MKDVVATEGFQEHGDNLVKVKLDNLHVMHFTIFIGGSFTCGE